MASATRSSIFFLNTHLAYGKHVRRIMNTFASIGEMALVDLVAHRAPAVPHGRQRRIPRRTAATLQVNAAV
jgi:hypothetical protein